LTTAGRVEIDHPKEFVFESESQRDGSVIGMSANPSAAPDLNRIGAKLYIPATSARAVERVWR